MTHDERKLKREMKKNRRKPNVGSSKQELMDYIKILEQSIRALNKRKESIETLTMAQTKQAQVMAEIVNRVSRLESTFNLMTEDVDGWRRDYSIRDIE